MSTIMFVRSWQLVSSFFTRFRLTVDRIHRADLAGRSYDEAAGSRRHLSTNELCVELLSHMLECEYCLNPLAKSCSVYSEFQTQIGLKGTPAGPVIYAM
jgi:hypothetical protein